MKILELFSGTESFSKVARERGHETYTIDMDKSFESDWSKDILDIKAEDILWKFAQPDIIWASPPCTCFSVASISTHWTGGHRKYIPKTEEAKQSIELINKTMEIIRKLKPRFFFIENPRGILRKLELVEGKRNTITYCQYGDERMKPTDVWTNLKEWNPKPMCKNGNSCHVPAPRGSKTGTQGRKNSVDRSKIPEKLCLEIIEICEKECVRCKNCGKLKESHYPAWLYSCKPRSINKFKIGTPTMQGR